VKTVVSIVVTYNGLRWIAKCIGSLANSRYPTDIIVVDNGSTDGTIEYIKLHYPSVYLVEPGRNLGFGQANNIGIRSALERKADHLFLLNQDAWVEPDTIGRLISLQSDNPVFGIISPLHYNGKGDSFDKYFENYFRHADNGKYWSADTLHVEKKEELLPVPFVNAAAWCISAACIKQTGGFDPIFFHYGEDLNYVQRAMARGFKTGIYTGTRIFHDREERLLENFVTPKKRLQNEWTHFLNQVCDIRVNGYRHIMFRRCLRYGFLTVIDLFTFNREDRKYHYQLTTRIIANWRMVKRSRITASQTATPYL
jgi:GT2 family glycosyltransferase